MKVKPRTLKVSGLPSPRRARRSAAKQPNSIRRVLPGGATARTPLTEHACVPRSAGRLMLEPDDDVVSIAHEDHIACGLAPSPSLGPETEHVVEVARRKLRPNPRQIEDGGNLAGQMIARHDLPRQKEQDSCFWSRSDAPSWPTPRQRQRITVRRNQRISATKSTPSGGSRHCSKILAMDPKADGRRMDIIRTGVDAFGWCCQCNRAQALFQHVF